MLLPGWVDRLALRALRWSRFGGAWALARRSSLRSKGWFLSYQLGRSVDDRGDPVPWIPYSASDLIERRLSKSMRVFEYGAGASTLWLSVRVKSVTSVEHDPGWLAEVRSKAADNVKLIQRPLEPPSNYAETAIHEGGGFDVVFIDGRHRNLCMEHAVNAVSDAGVIVLDNSERGEYATGIDHLKGHGFRQLAIRGLAPALLEETETSLFYRDGNVFGI